MLGLRLRAVPEVDCHEMLHDDRSENKSVAEIAAIDIGTEMTVVAALSSGMTIMEFCATGFTQLRLNSGIPIDPDVDE